MQTDQVKVTLQTKKEQKGNIGTTEEKADIVGNERRMVMLNNNDYNMVAMNGRINGIIFFEKIGCIKPKL